MAREISSDFFPCAVLFCILNYRAAVYFEFALYAALPPTPSFSRRAVFIAISAFLRMMGLYGFQ
jgi:hypothetical protein